MPPNGGPTRHGFDLTDEDIAEGGTFFESGEAWLDVEQTYVSGDLVVLVAVERQHGVVGDLPDQDLSLRITMVFRRDGARCVVHRHATGWCARFPSTSSHAWLAVTWRDDGRGPLGGPATQTPGRARP